MIAVVAGYAAALGIGALLALIGGGGAILALPVFIYLFHLPAWTATSHSLFVVGVTAAIGAVRHARGRSVDFNAALRFALPAIVAMQIVRNVIVPSLPNVFIFPGGNEVSKDLLVIATLVAAMLASATGMLRKREPQRVPSEGPRSIWRSTARGFGVGVFTGFVGAGGGFLLVPALVFVESLPIKRAVATSLLVIAVNSLTGFFGDLVAGAQPQWGLLVPFTALASLGMIAGTRAGHLLNERQAKITFGVALVLLAIGIVVLEVAK